MERTNDPVCRCGLRFLGVPFIIVILGFQLGAPSAEVVGASAEAVTAIMDDVTDGTRHFDEPALYMLLDRLRSGSVDVEAGKPFNHADLIGVGLPAVP